MSFGSLGSSMFLFPEKLCIAAMLWDMHAAQLVIENGKAGYLGSISYNHELFNLEYERLMQAQSVWILNVPKIERAMSKCMYFGKIR